MTPAARQTGFSLMEVLVALAVLAIAMAALVKSAGGFTANQAHLENKTIAHWVAMNQLAMLQVAERPSPGLQEGEQEMAGRLWRWSARLVTTPDAEVLKAEIRVRQEEGETLYALLTGYVGVSP